MSDETIPQMRERIDALQKEKGKLQEDLVSTRLEVKTLQARDLFRESGYRREHADLFVKTNPEVEEITEDAVAAFVKDYGLSPVQQEESTTKQDEEGGGTPDDVDLATLARGGSRAGAGGQQQATDDQTMTREEWRSLHKSDPVAARQAYAQGRVALREDNPFA